MRRILVLADDLTGALECGVLIEGAVVTLGAPVDAETPVVDTETRHVAPEAARDAIRRLTEQFPAELFYKKTDSTLRGNIGAELAALPPGCIHYAPAYPRLGRTVRHGRLFVDGVPVEQTAFARDPRGPVLDGDIRRVLARQGAPLDRVLIYDAEGDDDIERAAKAVLREPAPRLAAGPAALLASLAGRLGLTRRPGPLPRIAACVVINGSAHPVSVAQMAVAEAAGVFDGRWRAAPPGDVPEEPEALIVFGGDTARGILARYDDPPLHPVAEPLPGVVASWFEAGGRRLWFITKAGGFGRPDLLVRLRQMLTQPPGLQLSSSAIKSDF